MNTWAGLQRLARFDRALVDAAKLHYERGDPPGMAVADLQKNRAFAPLLDTHIKKGLEYGNTPLFANFFFFITGFHGFHVFSGVVINFIVFVLVARGFLDRKKDYELVEKVGLYWHFVDLVWVFVFTFFYLV